MDTSGTVVSHPRRRLVVDVPRRPRPGTEEWRPALLRPYRLSALGLVVLFLLLQFAIPARLVIGGLGAVGRPAVAVGLLLGALWLLCAVRPGRLPAGRQPVRWVLGIFLAVQVLGAAVGYDRLLPPVEESSMQRWLIFAFAMVGVGLAVADGVTDRRQLDLLLKALVGLGCFMAVVGALQFFGVVDLTQHLRVPGLRYNAELIGVGARGHGEFARVAGTANHYIEFGVVLALILPVALHYAFFAPRGWRRTVHWVAVGAIASAIPFSISRSAILTVVVATGLLAIVWPWRHRYNVLVVSVLATALFHVVNRGVLGTIKSLFVNADNDPSVQNRLSDTAYVMSMFVERPWVGRGAGTVLPDRYILLDNQFYGTLLAGGVVGVAALVALFAVPYFLARTVRLRAPEQESRHLAQALAATFPAALLASATFDSLSFATFTGVLFLLVGAVGALWRIEAVGPAEPLQVARPGDAYVTTPLTADLRDRLRAAWVSSRGPAALETPPGGRSRTRLAGTPA